MAYPDYKPGDRARLKTQFDGSYSHYPPEGTIITVDSLKDDLHVLFLWNGQKLSIHKLHIEPVFDISACTCDIRTLMTAGCRCGGT